MNRRVTLKDVAIFAGVSVTTVSNVVRDWPYVAEETRVKVQNAIIELGYSPHPIAQGLRTGRTQVIGFIVPDLSNPYFSQMVSIVEDIAQERGYSVSVFNTHENEEREAEAIRRVVSRWVDGLLISSVVRSRHTASLLHTIQIPIVAVDRIPDSFEGASCTLDNFRAAQLVMEHLANLGHQRIAYLSGPAGAQPARDRLEGYQRSLRARRLSYERIESSNIAWGSQDGYKSMQAIFTDKVLPTAVFASNDRMAIGASLAIHEHGLNVPDDISVVGVDDIEVSRYMNPPLTTVKQPLEQMARTGIDLLLKLINEETPSQAHMILAPSFQVRQSTAPPKA